MFIELPYGVSSLYFAFASILGICHKLNARADVATEILKDLVTRKSFAALRQIVLAASSTTLSRRASTSYKSLGTRHWYLHIQALSWPSDLACCNSMSRSTKQRTPLATQSFASAIPKRSDICGPKPDLVLNFAAMSLYERYTRGPDAHISSLTRVHGT